MARRAQKQCLIGTIGVLILAAVLACFPPIQTEYHKTRLQSLKQKRFRLTSQGLSGTDKFWLQVTGKPISVSDLDAAIRQHEAALVRLGFLHQHSLPSGMVSACPETLETLKALCTECPWYDSQIAATNLVITACPGMMDRWRKRAKGLGW